MLSRTSHPDLIFTSLREFGDDFLQVQIAVTLLVDKLAHLIGQHNQTVVIALVLQIGRQFRTETVDADIGVTPQNALTDAFFVKSRSQFASNVKHHAQLIVNHICCFAWIIPVTAFISNTLLELLKHTLFLQGLFEILSQREVELIKTTLAVELIPEYVQEGFLLIRRVVVTRFEVEDTSVDGGTFQPVGDAQYGIIVTADIVVLVHRINRLDCL